jgi:lysophospholipid acyltransferase (LPLAT)-like uncharacterized protein
LLKNFKKRYLSKMSNFLLPKIAKILMGLLLWTCRFEVKGLENFCEMAKTKKCLLLFWHNRLALAPFILTRLAPQLTYAAFVSNSRDGDLLAAIIHSFSCGRTIRVPHNNRHEALRHLIKHIETENDVVIITPDGPRGPSYVMKPGAALAAVETGAHVIPFDWKASGYWIFNTWDKLRLPKPFSTINISFDAAQTFQEKADLNSVIETLTQKLNR